MPNITDRHLKEYISHAVPVLIKLIAIKEKRAPVKWKSLKILKSY